MSLSVDEARARRVCRICEGVIRPSGVPRGWDRDFGGMVYPVAITLNYGAEFAHTACLPPEPEPPDDLDTATAGGDRPLPELDLPSPESELP